MIKYSLIPQMSPMYWLLLLLWMLIYSYMFISMMYFSMSNNIKTYTHPMMKKMNIKFNKMW